MKQNIITLLNVVITQSTTIFQLFSSENKSLLIRRDTFFVLDFCFHIFNSIRWFDLKSDGLTGEGFDEYLHFQDYTENTKQIDNFNTKQARSEKEKEKE